MAVVVSAELVSRFSTGLLVAPSPDLDHFLIAVAGDAFGWVIFASRTGWPVSTTYAMTGAIMGAALAAGSLDGDGCTSAQACATKKVSVPQQNLWTASGSGK